MREPHPQARPVTTVSLGTRPVVGGSRVRFRVSPRVRLCRMKKASTSGTASAPCRGKEEKSRICYTFSKWKIDMDKECQTVTWLDCDMEVQAGKRFVTKLRCSVCTKFKVKIVGRRNFCERWITGAESVRNSNIRDHARSDQHERIGIY